MTLVTLLLLGPALADHVFSHRLVVEGRLVDANGAPIPGREVELFTEGEDLLAPCRGEGQERVTDEYGDFRFCFHHHEVGPGTRVGVRSGNATTIKPVDVAFRRMMMLLRDDNATGLAPPAWNETYRISGRAWRVGPTTLEGVAVYGVAVIDLDVNLTVRDQNNATTTFHSRTDGFGDFDLVIETPANASNLSLTLEAQSRAQPTQLDPFFHRTYAPLYLPGEIDPSMMPAADPFFGDSFTAAPGSTTPKADPMLFVLVAIGLVAAVAISRRKNN